MPAVSPATAQMFIAALDNVFDTKTQKVLEVDAPTPNGLRSFETRIVPELDDHGDVATALVLSRDITESRQAREKLAAANRTLESVIESSPVAIVQLDRESKVQLWNPAAQRLFGWAADEVIGRPDPLVPAKDDALDSAIPWRLESGSTLLRQGVARLAKDGSPIPVDVYLYPIASPDGNVQGMVQILVDLRERRRAIEADELKAEQVMRARFLNTAAHELATPLTPIRLQVSALRRRLEGRLDDEERKGFDLVSRNVDRFTRLVQDLLDATRLQVGRLRMERKPVHIESVAADVVHSFADKAQEDGIALTYVANGTLDVEGDETRVSQVLINLVQNALKFTPRGGAVNVDAHAAANGVDIEVTDTGIGMRPDEAQQLFQPFLRLEQATAKAGTGLGLYICKGIVEQHGGTVRAQSAGPGKGSTFLVHLPLHPPATLTTGIAAA